MRKFNSMMVLSDESLNQVVGGKDYGGGSDALLKVQGAIITKELDLITKVLTTVGVRAATALTRLFVAFNQAMFPLLSGGGGSGPVY